jgi:hypothetical protein
MEIQIENNVDTILVKLQQNLKTKMEDATMAVRNKSLEVLSGTRSGRTYVIPGTKVTYTASAPGEPPAVQTGRLRQSVATEISSDGMVGKVGTTLDYGQELEQGRSNMAPRPWLKPSFEQSENEVMKIFTADYDL